MFPLVLGLDSSQTKQGLKKNGLTLLLSPLKTKEIKIKNKLKSLRPIMKLETLTVQSLKNSRRVFFA
jgi:hypothetical protein